MQNVSGFRSGFRRNCLKTATIALIAAGLSACGGPSSLWQGEEVLVEARQDVLERDVYNVSDDHRELKDRFNALERLYVELVHQLRNQTAKMSAIEAQLKKVEHDPEAAARLTKVRNDVSVIREQMKKLETRVFSVEMSEPEAGVSGASVTPLTTNVGPAQASIEPEEATSAPANNQAQAQQTFFGVHLASYRSQEQVGSGWNGLMQAYGSDLEGLTPLVYTQSQEGIGTFLRLIAGPLINEQEANALCGRIRESASEQYCRVSEYQGEPVQ